MRFLLIGAVCAALGGGAVAQSLPDGPLFMGYYESWKELPAGSPRLTRLAQMPGGPDIVVIGFAKPDLSFDGTHLESTGLQVPFDVPMLRDSIAALRKLHPRIKVLLSVGGSGYNKTWEFYDAEALARLVKAVGADGVDLDYEPPAPNCAKIQLNEGADYRCSSEDVWARAIRSTRAVLPRPYVISLQGWSVGAYGAGRFAGDIPVSQWTGSMLWLGRLPEAKEVDVVAVMAYDAGPSLDVQRAFDSYRAVWPGRLLLGVNVPAEGTKALPFTVPQLKRLSAVQAKDPRGGVMLYAVTDDLKEDLSMNRPDGELAAHAICEGLGRTDCD